MNIKFCCVFDKIVGLYCVFGFCRQLLESIDFIGVLSIFDFYFKNKNISLVIMFFGDDFFSKDIFMKDSVDLYM